MAAAEVTPVLLHVGEMQRGAVLHVCSILSSLALALARRICVMGEKLVRGSAQSVHTLFLCA